MSGTGPGLRRLLTALALVLGAGAASAASGEAPGREAASARPPMPYEIVRSLQFLQDQIARGNDKAIPVQARMLRRFAPNFVSAPAETWDDPRNLGAAALFVLSGGPPHVLQAILEKIETESEWAGLLQGALAYVENRKGTALAKLQAVDLSRFEPGLAAQVHLAIAQLAQIDDPQTAMRHLDRARLLAPGTLVEEAALRLEVLLADQLGRHDKADRLARQYFDRYADSSYSENFQARFAAVYAGRPHGDEQKSIDTILDATAHLPDEDKTALYLAVGRRALIVGNRALAAAVAKAVLEEEGASPKDRSRANLYAIAASLPSRSLVEARVMLNAIDETRLHPDDRALHRAALAVLAGMRAAPEPEEKISDPLAPPLPPADEERRALVARARTLLNAVSDDLARTKP